MATYWVPLEKGEIAVAHLSDLHVGSKNWNSSWLLLQQCLLDTVKPSLILVTGDLTDTPKESFYKSARNELGTVATALGMTTGQPIPYFVCAGNHDRFFKGNRFNLAALSRGWPRVALTLLFIIMGLVVYAMWNLVHLTIFLVVFGVVVWTLPWILDRIPSASASFGDTFGEHVLSPKEARPVPLTSGSSTWTLGLFGVDSSVDADSSARGWVSHDQFAEFSKRTHHSDHDLCVFLVHHHVLPVRQLEAKRKSSRADLFNLTCLVNAGSLLESLADAHVDLVLHGHEHEYNWGSYGSLSSGSVNVRVVAAGSATGNNSLTGCNINDATFNVIILSPDRSARLRRLKYSATAWKVEEEFRLFSPSELRSSKAHRAKKSLKDEILSEITKYVEFTRDRDIFVRWVFTNWLPGKHYEQTILNSTGVIDDIQVGLFGPAGEEDHPEPVKQKVGDHQWSISWNVDEKLQNTPLTMEIQYKWHGGGILTEAEMKYIQSLPAPGPYRQEAYEFATVWTPAPVASAELFLVFPPEYAPDDVHVRVTDKTGAEVNAEARELDPRCRPLAVGVYALRIPFPRIEHQYSLVWQPFEAEEDKESEDYAAFNSAARERARPLLHEFRSVFEHTPWWGKMTLALYLINKSSSPKANRVDFDAPGRATPLASKPPDSVDLVGNLSAMTQAWWGNPTLMLRKKSPKAAQGEFVDGETAFLCLPLRFGFEWVNPPPWGIVRLGIIGEEQVTEETENLWTILSVATMKTLALAILPEKVTLAVDTSNRKE